METRLERLAAGMEVPVVQVEVALPVGAAEVPYTIPPPVMVAGVPLAVIVPPPTVAAAVVMPVAELVVVTVGAVPIEGVKETLSHPRLSELEPPEWMNRIYRYWLAAIEAVTVPELKVVPVLMFVVASEKVRAEICVKPDVPIAGGVADELT